MGPARAGIEERFRHRAERAIANRRVFRYLASATLLLSLGAGILVRFIDPEDFPTLGDGLWWALVTLATVGYGDIVPTSGWGRVVGSFVIVMGVTFLSFLTATVTSYFVSSDQAERAKADDTHALLEEILSRMAAIEAAQPRSAGEKEDAGRAEPPR